jgi:protein MpaA
VPSTEPAKNSTLDPRLFTAEIETVARAAGFRSDPFGEAAGCRLLGLTRRARGVVPRIYISAGIHGDEPAPPLALLELMTTGFFDDRATWFICPLLNPAGFLRAARENAEGIDLNRDYKTLKSIEIAAHVVWLRRQPNFDLTLCLHEDWESKGFYLYELNPHARPSLAHDMIAAVAKVCPIETATVIDGREIAEPGIIRPVNDPLLRETWPESIYLRANHAMLSYTLETPSALPLSQRIAALRAAITSAVRAA